MTNNDGLWFIAGLLVSPVLGFVLIGGLAALDRTNARRRATRQ
jgi:hypothetical protein